MQNSLNNLKFVKQKPLNRVKYTNKTNFNINTLHKTQQKKEEISKTKYNQINYLTIDSMKISNYRLTRRIAYLLIISIIASVLIVIISKNMTVDIALSVLCILLIFFLLRLQCIVFENSGNCITFRKHHPFTLKRFIPPFIELPQSSIKDYDFRKGLGVSHLTLKINSQRKKKMVVKLFLLGFTNSQNKKIISSLQFIKLNRKD